MSPRLKAQIPFSCSEANSQTPAARNPTRRLLRRRRLRVAGLTLLLATTVTLFPGGGPAAFALGGGDTATGAFALNLENGGSGNTADGYYTLSDNMTGQGNTAVGSGALGANNTANFSTAIGYLALGLSTGAENTAGGTEALGSNQTGKNNTGFGFGALSDTTTGSNNTSLGYEAGISTPGAQPPNTNVTGSNNTFLGSGTGPGTSAEIDDATAIGENARVGENNALVLGGTGPDAVKTGIGTTTPQSLLQVGTPGKLYGKYVQIPIVSKNTPPPAVDCNASTLAGRMVLQSAPSRVVLWVCSTSGHWVSLASH